MQLLFVHDRCRYFLQRNLRCRLFLQRAYCLCTCVAENSATQHCLCTSDADIFCNAIWVVAEKFRNAVCVAEFHHRVGLTSSSATINALQITATQRWLALQKICNPVFCIAKSATQSALQIISATHYALQISVADTHFFVVQAPPATAQRWSDSKQKNGRHRCLRSSPAKPTPA